MKHLWILAVLAFLAVACNNATSAAPATQPVSAAQEVPCPLPAATSVTAQRARISFIVNVHDFLHVDESADTLLRLIDIFEKYGVRGEFYVTGPITQLYLEQRPDLVARLRESDMTISYHARPPHPVYAGFDQRLQGLSGDALAATLREYETYRLDLATGDLLRDEPGGYSFVAETFGRPPVVASSPQAKYRPLLLPIFREMGAQATIIYHESGTAIDQPFQWVEGLLVRPSDFSITRWVSEDSPKESFWWNRLEGPLADQYNPTAYLQKRLAAWDETRPPFITVLIHENNFYRAGGTPFANIYWQDGDRSQPKQPPFDLDTPDASRPRSPQNQAHILAAYEELVAYAAANLDVVTSEDLVALAGGQVAPDGTCIFLPLVRASAEPEATPMPTPLPTPEPTPEPAPAEPAPLLFTVMTHMEATFTDDEDQAVFLRHLEDLRRGMDWFEEYGAKMTIESEEPFAKAQAKWGVNLMAEALERGHGVGTHCDVGFRTPLMSVEEFASLLAERKALVDALVGAENNRGCSGAGGVNDWAQAAHLAGFEYIDGVVGMHYLSMPLENRPDPSWTDAYIRAEGYHLPAPQEMELRIHPFMVRDARDFLADEDGVILVSSGEIGRLDRMAEGGDQASCRTCPLTDEDTDALVEAIRAIAELHAPSRVGKVTVYLPVENFRPGNEAAMRTFLAAIQSLEEEGLVTWATQGEVLDIYREWN